MKINIFVFDILSSVFFSANIAFASSYSTHDPMQAGMIGVVKYIGFLIFGFALWAIYKLFALIFKKAGEGLNKLAADPRTVHKESNNNEDR